MQHLLLWSKGSHTTAPAVEADRRRWRPAGQCCWRIVLPWTPQQQLLTACRCVTVAANLGLLVLVGCNETRRNSLVKEANWNLVDQTLSDLLRSRVCCLMTGFLSLSCACSMLCCALAACGVTRAASAALWHSTRGLTTRRRWYVRRVSPC